jgi:DNA-binding GntR family transcriptional regulator
VNGLRLGPVARQSLSEQAAAILRDKITSGELLPGTSLREVELAEQLAVGRAAVREACRQLIGEGLLVNQHHRGPSVWQPTSNELAELYELRAAMEGMCVRLSLEHQGRAALVDALEPIVAEMGLAEAADDHTRVDALDARFHGVVVKLSGNQQLERIWLTAHPIVWTAAIPALRAPVREPVIAAKHRRLLDALRTCTPRDAQEAMIVHIREGEYDAIHNVSHDGEQPVEPTDGY